MHITIEGTQTSAAKVGLFAWTSWKISGAQHWLWRLHCFLCKHFFLLLSLMILKMLLWHSRSASFLCRCIFTLMILLLCFACGTNKVQYIEYFYVCLREVCLIEVEEDLEKLCDELLRKISRLTIWLETWSWIEYIDRSWSM